MSSASTNNTNSKLAFVKADTKVSSYDTFSSFLIASLVIVGFFATILSLIWLTTTFKYDMPREIILVEPLGDDGDDKPEGFEDDALDPGVDDFPEVETPQLAQALEAVTDAVSSVKASLAERSGDAAVNGAGGGYGSREGGSSGNGSGIIPEYKRWKINYQAEDIETYKRQLSQWEIDIGVLNRNSDDVFRVQNPAGNTNVVTSSRTQESDSLYFAHIKPRMKRWDEVIASGAGVNIEEVNMIQFYSDKARMRIRQQEAEMLDADGREAKDIRATIIRLASSDGSFDFIVDQIKYAN